MARTNPFTVTIYSKGLAFQQVLGSAISYSFTPRYTLGTGEVTTRSDDPANAFLMTPGARMVVQYRGEVLMSGFVQQQNGSILRGGTVTWYLYDDRYLLTFVRAWVRPGQNLSASSLSDLAQQVPRGTHVDGKADGLGYYAWPSPPVIYPAESAIKQVIRENLLRFGSNVAQGKIVIQTDQARGGDARAGNVLPQLRFDALHDGLLDLLTWSGLLLKVWQDPTPIGTVGTLKLDVFAPKTWTQVISARSTIIADGTYQQAMPTLTRLILGGNGEDAERLFYGQNDATGLEDLYGIAVEGFTEATGASLKWPDGLDESFQVAMYYLQRSDVAAADKAALSSYLLQTATAALRAGRSTAGLNISLSETASFHYGGTDGYHVGDSITVQVENGPSITQRITECTLTYSISSGFAVTPQVGDITEDTTQALGKAIASLAQAVNRISTRT